MTKRTRKQSRRCFWSALGHRIHLRKFGYGDWFFVAVLFLLVVGTVNVFSSTFYMNLRSASGVTSDLSRHALFLALGAICGGLVYRFNYQNLRKSMTLWIGITVLMLLLVQVAGLTVNGARGGSRWEDLRFNRPKWRNSSALCAPLPVWRCVSSAANRCGFGSRWAARWEPPENSSGNE